LLFPNFVDNKISEKKIYKRLKVEIKKVNVPLLTNIQLINNSLTF